MIMRAHRERREKMGGWIEKSWRAVLEHNEEEEG